MVEKTDSEAMVREIKRRTRKIYTSREKIRIVLEGSQAMLSSPTTWASVGSGSAECCRASRESPLDDGRKAQHE
jgi:hypothetical protein